MSKISSKGNYNMTNPHGLIYIEPTHFYITDTEPLGLYLESCCGMVFAAEKIGVAHTVFPTKIIGKDESCDDNLVLTPREGANKVLNELLKAGILRSRISAGIFGCTASGIGIENYLEAKQAITELRLPIFHEPPYADQIEQALRCPEQLSPLHPHSYCHTQMVVWNRQIRIFYCAAPMFELGEPDEIINLYG